MKKEFIFNKEFLKEEIEKHWELYKFADGFGLNRLAKEYIIDIQKLVEFAYLWDIVDETYLKEVLDKTEVLL